LIARGSGESHSSATGAGPAESAGAQSIFVKSGRMVNSVSDSESFLPFGQDVKRLAAEMHEACNAGSAHFPSVGRVAGDDHRSDIARCFEGWHQACDVAGVLLIGAAEHNQVGLGGGNFFDSLESPGGYFEAG